MSVGCSVNDCMCVLMDEMGRFEFWSFYIDIEVMQVYIVGSEGHVSSCFRGLFFFGVLWWAYWSYYLLFFVDKFLV
jgi:hypothetical protein